MTATQDVRRLFRGDTRDFARDLSRLHLPGPRLAALTLGALFLSTNASLAAPWPFEGAWDCEVALFTFTDASYDNGEDVIAILDIAPEGDTFTLTLEDNYQLSLAMNPDQTMTWFSPVSGDSFLCRKAE